MHTRLSQALVLGSVLLLGCGDDGFDNNTPPPTLSIISESVRDPELTIAYVDTIRATGGSGLWEWAIVAGTLPAGLTLEADEGTGARIKGTPTALGSSAVTFGVASPDGQTDTKEITITVVIATLYIVTSDAHDTISGIDAVADAAVNKAYDETVKALGGDATYTFSLIDGSLPAGLSLAANGDITGTATVVGTQYFTVQVVSGAQTDTQVLSLTVNAPLAIQTVSLPDAVGGVEYDVDLMATGGDGAYTWLISADTLISTKEATLGDTTIVSHLPKGLELTGKTITGTPTGSGTSFTVFLEDGADQSDSGAFSITVALGVVTSSLAAAPVNVKYSATVEAMGGDGDYTWTITSGTLPTGLSIVDSTGVIKGTPTATGVSAFTVQVEDGDAETATRAFSISVTAGTINITTKSVPSAEIDVAYSETLAAVGGDGSYTFTIIGGGTLPTGLSLAANGDITGTPTVLETQFITVRVVDGDGQIATKDFSVSVNLALAVTTLSLPDGTVGAAYGDIPVEVVGGDGDYTWSVTAGALPLGLSLDDETGEISGKPTTAGDSTFTIEVEDGNGATATQDLEITVS